MASELTNILQGDIAVYHDYISPAIKKLFAASKRGTFTPHLAAQEFTQVVLRGINRINGYMKNLKTNTVLDYDGTAIHTAAQELLGIYADDIASGENIGSPIPWVDKNGTEIKPGNMFMGENGAIGQILAADYGMMIRIGKELIPLYELGFSFNGKQRVMFGVIQ